MRNQPTSAQSTQHRAHVRSPVDLLRLILGLALIAVGVASSNLFDSALLGLAQDGDSAFSGLPAWVSDVPASIFAGLIAVGALAATGWALITTRFRRAALLALSFGLAAGASVVVGDLVVNAIDADVRAALDIDAPLFRYTIDGLVSPSDPLLAGAVAMLGVAGSYFAGHLARRVGAFLAIYALFAAFLAAIPALGIIADAGIGLSVAAIVLLIFGRHDLAPQEDELRRALHSIGMDVHGLHRLDVDARGSTPWQGSVDDRKVFVKALGRDERSADLMFRLYRWGRYRKTGDHRPFVSLRRAVEHEALVAHQAAALGLRTPRVLGVVEAGIDGMVIVYEALDGRSADGFDDISDEALQTIWSMVAELHQRRIAHRDLRLANIFITDQGEPLLIDFGFSELAASDQQLGTDVAELLASTASLVGVERAVAAAHAATGLAEMERALPWLQSSTLSTATRDAIGGQSGIDPIRQMMIEECGIAQEPAVRIERVDGRRVFLITTVALSGWFLIPQIADIDNIWRQVRMGSVTWSLVAVALSLVSYAAATASLLGAVPYRLRFAPALVAQLGSSFANRITPARVGGVATNVRYLQRQGVPVKVGVAAVGVNAVAGAITHISLIIVFLLLSSSSQADASLPIPSPTTLGLAAGIAATVVIVAVALPATRRLLREHVLPQLQSGLDTVRQLAHQPTKLALLFGGSAAITLAYMGAMIASLEAFGTTADLPILGLLFLTGSAVANAAPTPGGLGAAEAALIAAFSAVEETEIVVPAVFLFRFVTFWLPILPGWLSLTWLRSTDRI